MVMIRDRLFAPIFLFIISLFAIIFGIILTVSIIFIYIGLPLLIIGIILLLASIVSFFGETVQGILSLFRLPKRHKAHVKEKPKKKKEKKKIIDVKEEGGVYKAE